MKEVKAIHKYAKISPFKVRLIAEQIRNKSVEEALNILSFSNKKAAVLVKKVLSFKLNQSTKSETTATKTSCFKSFSTSLLNFSSFFIFSCIF